MDSCCSGLSPLPLVGPFCVLHTRLGVASGRKPGEDAIDTLEQRFLNLPLWAPGALFPSLLLANTRQWNKRRQKIQSLIFCFSFNKQNKLPNCYKNFWNLTLMCRMVGPWTNQLWGLLVRSSDYTLSSTA